MNGDEVTLIDSAAKSTQEAQGNDLHPIGELNRREWLQYAAVGGLHLGLLGSALPAFGQEAEKATCLYMVKLSKGIRADISSYKCSPCRCAVGNEMITVFRIEFEFKGQLTNYQICDDSLRQIPQRSTVKGAFKFTLRNGKCEESKKPILWGCHQGRFELYDPKTRRIFSGSLSGTNGFDPRTSGEERCCWPYGAGYLRGKGIEALKECEVCASYLLKVPFNEENPCTKTPPKELAMQLDGMVICPCRK